MPPSPPRNWAPCCDLGTCLTSQLCNHFLRQCIVSANQCHISLQTEMENNQLLVLENEWKWSNNPLHSVFMSSFYLLIFPFSWEESAVECFRRTGVGFSLVLHTLRLHAAINAFLQGTGQWGSLSWTMILFLFFRNAGFWSTTSISKRAEQHQPQPFIW